MQETIARALESVARFQWQGKESFRRWVQGIAENVVREAARKHRWDTGLEIVRDQPAETESPSRLAMRDERFERLQNALDGLSEDHRQVILLARIEGVGIEEIAARMNRSTNAVRTLLFRAMKELKKTFGDTGSLHLPERRLAEKGGRDE